MNLGERQPVHKIVQYAHDKFFELGVEAQDLAFPLIVEAAIQRGRNFPAKKFSLIAEREAAENRWKDYLRGLGDKLVQSMDPTYWPGHRNHIEITRIRNTFLHIFDSQDASTLLQTKELLEKILGK